MKRAALEKGRTRRTWAKHWNNHVEQEIRSGRPKDPSCACDTQVNRFRKGQKAFGCGKARCYLCHGEKLLGIEKARYKALQQKGLKDEE